MELLMASGIFSLTFGLLIFRPNGMREGTAGAVGALLMLGLGLVDVKDIGEVILETRGILVMLLAMMAISIVVDEAGVFQWIAVYSARLARGSGHRLFLNTFLMGTLVTTVISNDATALIITPIVFSVVTLLGINPIPFLLICTFIADTASLTLPVSNLTNLLVYDQLALAFFPYVLVMLLPTIVAVIINYLVFLWLFRRTIPENFNANNLPVPELYITHLGFFRAAAFGLIGIIIGYVVGSWLGIGLAWIGVAGAILLMISGVYYRQLKLKRVFTQISWSVLVFVVGMFVVVRGIQNTGMPELIGLWLMELVGDNLLRGVVYTAVGTAVGSNIINNVPMDLMMVSMLKSVANESLLHPLGYATILGAGLGPNLSIIGSLATMLWLGTIRRKGVDITPWQYLKVGAITAPPMILAAAFALWLSIIIVG